MFTVYVYVMDTLADWEIGHVIAELHSGRFFKTDAPKVYVKTVGRTMEPIRTMGGLTVLPDCTVDDIAVDAQSVLLLPGGNTWDWRCDLRRNGQPRTAHESARRCRTPASENPLSPSWCGLR